MLKSGFLWIGPIALMSLSALSYGRQAGQDLRVPQTVRENHREASRAIASL
jgi:hypothetical protein